MQTLARKGNQDSTCHPENFHQLPRGVSVEQHVEIQGLLLWDWRDEQWNGELGQRDIIRSQKIVQSQWNQLCQYKHHPYCSASTFIFFLFFFYL